MMRPPRKELIDCYDCQRPVSFTATRCPQCGSTQPAGPYVMSTKEIKNFRIEERNDRNMIMTAIGLGAIGGLYGWLHSTGVLSAFFGIIAYGLLGILVGAPLGLVANALLGPLTGLRRRRFK